MFDQVIEIDGVKYTAKHIESLNKIEREALIEPLFQYFRKLGFVYPDDLDKVNKQDDDQGEMNLCWKLECPEKADRGMGVDCTVRFMRIMSGCDFRPSAEWSSIDYLTGTPNNLRFVTNHKKLKNQTLRRR